MRVRNRPGAKEKIIAHDKFIAEDGRQFKGKWSSYFDTNQPLYIEVGTGKGQFIHKMAVEYPEVNFLGIEQQASVVSIALDKLIEKPLPNLRLLHADGADMLDIFDVGEVDRIFLNFSDPWPKKRHIKRRLTAPSFLEKYFTILTKNGKIEQKTDNTGLFEYSLASFSQNLFLIEEVRVDLHDDSERSAAEITTEYEDKFRNRNKQIHKVIVRKNNG